MMRNIKKIHIINNKHNKKMNMDTFYKTEKKRNILSIL
ncbi:hypothetical protein bthur0013_67110 [Bacillus thuringiensis IBL 200]|nr:hypothetical protein bthur0013_67110 [Bacillus thuringiensis IBL 200]